MRNGPVTPKDEGFAKQTQVMFLGGWSAEDVTKLEPLAGALVGAMAQALLVLKGASNLYSNFLQPPLSNHEFSTGCDEISVAATRI